MPVQRLLPTAAARELIALVRDIGDKELSPHADSCEAAAALPPRLFETLAGAELLGLPYDEDLGGGGQPYEVYLQVLEEPAARWAAVAVAISVHSLACHPLASFGTPAQRERLPGLPNDGRLAACSLSEAHCGSDAAALRCAATKTPDGWRVDGSKSRITSGGIAGSYTLFARTGPDRTRGVSCFLVPGDAPGLALDRPEDKTGLRAVPTTGARYARVLLGDDSLVGQPGQGVQIAYSALDSGRLRIAAIATGLAQAALDQAVAYAEQREAFVKAVIDHQGLAFLLADRAAAVDGSRAAYLDAARRRDAGMPYTRQASVAKLLCTDAAMQVTTDAVQVLGGAGYTRDHRLERYMREAKVMQIFEGTNQIQRVVISRTLGTAGPVPS